MRWQPPLRRLSSANNAQNMRGLITILTRDSPNPSASKLLSEQDARAPDRQGETKDMSQSSRA
jgi:hypothetical protein